MNAKNLRFKFALAFVFFCLAPIESLNAQALIPRNVFNNPPTRKLTKSVCNSFWGHDGFVYPHCSALSFTMYEDQYGVKTLFSAMTFFSDNLSHDIVYTEGLDNWVRRTGSFGSALGQFQWPGRVAVLHDLSLNNPGDGRYYYLYVADDMNNRIDRLQYNAATQTVTNLSPIVASNFTVEDLDVDNGGSFNSIDDDTLWVACSDRAIRKFTKDGILKATYMQYFKLGTGQYAPFRFIRAMVSGRFYLESAGHQAFANNRSFIIATGGNGVDSLYYLGISQGGQYLWLPPTFGTWQAPAGAIITSIETDGFGHVWAADMANSKIYKLDRQLFYLTEFGTYGTGDNQFVGPHTVSTWKEGLIAPWNQDNTVASGDIMIMEKWDANSGIQYYAIGTDIVNYTPSSSEFKGTHFVNFRLVDPSIVTCQVFDSTQTLVRTITNGMFELSYAYAQKTWDGLKSSGFRAPSGNYKIRSTAKSVYNDYNQNPPVPVNSVTKEATVFNIYRGDPNWSGNVNITDITYLKNYVFYGGPSPKPVLEAGDCNCNHLVNLQDIVLLVNYIYKSGPAPCNM